MWSPVTTDDWPYAEDGVQRDQFAESLRIPLIGTTHPRRTYITAVVVGVDHAGRWIGVRPTDDELRVVRSFHEQYLSHLTSWWVAQMAEEPFDIDPGAVGRYLIKYDHGGWGYRLSTWLGGPSPRPNQEPMGLVALLDRGAALMPKTWQQWKADHAEVFAAVAR